jgi:hypothetical protein
MLPVSNILPVLLDILHLRVLLRDGQAGDALELGNRTVGGTLDIDVNKFNDAFQLHVLWPISQHFIPVRRSAQQRIPI